MTTTTTTTTQGEHAQTAPGYEHQRAIMEGERNASLALFDHDDHLTLAEERLYESAFTNGWDRHAAVVAPTSAPMSPANRLVAYSAATRLRELGFEWDATAEAWLQPAQGVAYAELPDTDLGSVTGQELDKGWYSAQQMRDFADRTHALRASHGQAPAGAAPMTEQQMDAIWEECKFDNGDEWSIDWTSAVRAAERLHGIKGADHV